MLREILVKFTADLEKYAGDKKDVHKAVLKNIRYDQEEFIELYDWAGELYLVKNNLDSVLEYIDRCMVEVYEKGKKQGHNDFRLRLREILG